MKRIYFLIVLFSVVLSFDLFSQVDTSDSVENAEDDLLLGSLDEGLLEPIFSESSSGLIYIEGEDAVSTNFATQPVSNFGCSGYSSVQLNREVGLQGRAAFYAEYVFYVEEDGDYEFWYGGTPPGPRDEMSPSYSSPFSYILDNNAAVDVYREDMHVIEGYSPSYYWNSCGDMFLKKGSHKIRIEVSKKRAYDGRYYFYLDSLFFLNRARIDEVDAVKPDVFPSDLESDIIDNPFLSISDYQKYLDKNPKDGEAFLELSLVYSLVGDYQAAVKTLTRAMAVMPDDSYPVVLAAKNRLWNGDLNESLDLYQRALDMDSSNKTLWAEAGKVAAWSAMYDRAIQFFEEGLEVFPDDLNLKVNMALTKVWMSQSADADKILNDAYTSAKTDPDKLAELASIEEAVGYSDYAQDVYEKSIEEYPQYLDFYLMLQSSFLASGDDESASEVEKRIGEVFVSSDKLKNKLDIYHAKLDLRNEVINSILERLKNNPDDLSLRQELAQMYFWNGMRSEAIEQMRYVIATYAYIAAGRYVNDNKDFLSVGDKISAIRPFIFDIPDYFQVLSKELKDASSHLASARKASEKADAKAYPEDDSEIDPDAIKKAAEAAKALEEAEQAYANLSSESDYLKALADSYTDEYQQLKTTAHDMVTAFDDEYEAFNKVIEPSGWTWSKDWQIGELRQIAQKEPRLASFMLGRALMSDGEFSDAEDALSFGIGDDESSSSITAAELYSLYQAAFYGGDTGLDGARKSLFDNVENKLRPSFPHLEEVEDNLSLNAEMQKAFFDTTTEDADDSGKFNFYTPPEGSYSDGMEAGIDDLEIQLNEYRDSMLALQDDVDESLSLLDQACAKLLERATYYLESDTYLIRYELGNYYLEADQNTKAAEQFKRVLIVDPWNISAAYKFGVVEQRYGNWYEAMKYYKRVYNVDNNYENTVVYNNQLARMHADKAVSNVLLTTSPDEVSLKANLAYNTEFNNVIGLGIDYTLDQQRRYSLYNYSTDTDVEQGTFQVHKLELSLPFSFDVIGIQLVPRAGIFVDPLYYKQDYAVTDDPVSFGEFIQQLSTYPTFGGSAIFTWKFLTVNASYDWTFEDDTFYPYGTILTPIRKHDIEVYANTWIEFPRSNLLGPLTTSTYAHIELMDDDVNNIMFLGHQDLMLGFNVLRNPVLKFTPGAIANYEISRTDDVSRYYAPMGVLEVKGQLKAQFTIPSKDWSRALDTVLWGGGGGVWYNVGIDGEDVTSYIKAEGGCILSWVKNGSIYQLNFSTFGTFDSSDDYSNTYWEFSLSLGTNLSLPDLLAK